MANYDLNKTIIWGSKEEIEKLSLEIIKDPKKFEKVRSYYGKPQLNADLIDTKDLCPFNHLEVCEKLKMPTGDFMKIYDNPEPYLKKLGYRDFLSSYTVYSADGVNVELTQKKLYVTGKNEYCLILNAVFKTYEPIAFLTEIAEKRKLSFVTFDGYEGYHATIKYNVHGEERLYFYNSIENYFSGIKKKIGLDLELFNQSELLVGAVMFDKVNILKNIPSEQIEIFYKNSQKIISEIRQNIMGEGDNSHFNDSPFCINNFRDLGENGNDIQKYLLKKLKTVIPTYEKMMIDNVIATQRTELKRKINTL